MFTCPQGHQSKDAQWCSECGFEIPGATPLTAPSVVEQQPVDRSSAPAGPAAAPVSGNESALPDQQTPQAGPPPASLQVHDVMIIGLAGAGLPPLMVPDASAGHVIFQEATGSPSSVGGNAPPADQQSQMVVARFDGQGGFQPAVDGRPALVLPSLPDPQLQPSRIINWWIATEVLDEGSQQQQQPAPEADAPPQQVRTFDLVHKTTFVGHKKGDILFPRDNAVSSPQLLLQWDPDSGQLTAKNVARKNPVMLQRAGTNPTELRYGDSAVMLQEGDVIAMGAHSKLLFTHRTRT